VHDTCSRRSCFKIDYIAIYCYIDSALAPDPDRPGGNVGRPTGDILEKIPGPNRHRHRRRWRLGRSGQPDDLPGAILFFASDDAGYITGQVLSVSGGLTMNG